MHGIHSLSAVVKTRRAPQFDPSPSHIRPGSVGYILIHNGAASVDIYSHVTIPYSSAQLESDIVQWVTSFSPMFFHAFFHHAVSISPC